ncbi:MAG TPA: carboxypeptidase-like regulatory domain-containing protein [Candidatus Acidoferrum sp.]|nr:carboxypeptidase-like regulatory domain-containing protein [Candidatus Acidoferrum sp.]
MLKRLALISIVSIVCYGAVCHHHQDQDPNFGTIKGKVTDSVTGEPIIGATVLVNGTKLGAQTDPDGLYRIARIPPGEYMVICASVGYNTVEIPDIHLSEGMKRTLDVKLRLHRDWLGPTIHQDNARRSR